MNRHFPSPGTSGDFLAVNGTGSAWVTPPLPSIRLPVGFTPVASVSKSPTSGTSYAYYLGRADRAYTSVAVRFGVAVIADTVSWAEVAVATGTPSLGGNPKLTTRGSSSVAGSLGTTGAKSATITTSGIALGDHLWLLIGQSATTPADLVAGAADRLTIGVQASATARPSTMSADTDFTVEGAADRAVWLAWSGS